LFDYFDNLSGGKEGDRMDRIVILSEDRLEVGRDYPDFRDPLGEAHPEGKFRVVRESTREEWVKCQAFFGDDRDWGEFLILLRPYFYEIQTD